MLRRAFALTLVVPAVALTTGALPASAATPPGCHGVAATIVGTPGDDKLVGTNGPDVIVGLGGNDHIRGLRGHDLLCGGLGADELVGGRGGDALNGGPDQHRLRPDGLRLLTGDLLDGGPGDDVLDAHADHWRHALVKRPDTVTYRSSHSRVIVDLRAGTGRGDGHDTIVRDDRLQLVGSAFDDQLSGSSAHDVLVGRAGDDRLVGRGAGDVLIDRAGDDVLVGGPGGDQEFSDLGSDTLGGNAGADMLFGLSSRPTTVHGGRGSDFVGAALVSDANGVLDGGPGSNQLSLQMPHADVADASVDRAAGTAVAQSGTASASASFSRFDGFTLGGTGTWSYVGTDAPDFVQVVGGSLDASTLGGDDMMIGDTGDDTLDGGDGMDRVWGGAGSNTCLNDEQGSCDGYPQDFPLAARTLPPRQDAGFARDLPRVHRLLERYAPQLR